MLPLGAVTISSQLNTTCDSAIDHNGDHQMAKGSMTTADTLGAAVL